MRSVHSDNFSMILSIIIVHADNTHKKLISDNSSKYSYTQHACASHSCIFITTLRHPITLNNVLMMTGYTEHISIISQRPWSRSMSLDPASYI